MLIKGHSNFEFRGLPGCYPPFDGSSIILKWTSPLEERLFLKHEVHNRKFVGNLKNDFLAFSVTECLLTAKIMVSQTYTLSRKSTFLPQTTARTCLSFLFSYKACAVNSFVTCGHCSARIVPVTVLKLLEQQHYPISLEEAYSEL